MKHQTVMREFSVAILSAACLAALPGCFTSHTTGSQRTPPEATLPADAWPMAETAELEALQARTPQYPSSFQLADGEIREWLNPDDLRRLGERPYDVTYNAMHPGGLLRVWGEPPRAPTPEFDGLMAMLGNFNANASFLSLNLVEQARTYARLSYTVDLPDVWIEMNPLAVSVRPGVVPVVEADGVLLREGIGIEFPPQFSRRPRGLVVHVLSLIPNMYEDGAVEALRRRGWAVVTVDPKTTVCTPHPPADLERFETLARRYRELNVQEYRRLTRSMLGAAPKDSPRGVRALMQDRAEETSLIREMMALRRGRFDCDSPADAERVGAAIAQAVDANLADSANAVSAVLAYVREHRPDITPRPLVIVGFSAGALATPAIAARLIEDGNTPDAIVLLGGGADLLDVSRHTSMQGSAIPIRSQGGVVPDNLWNQIHDSYVRHVKLDPLKTAPLLTGIPVLQVHARMDTIVPAPTGERLYTLLGQPDRIDYFLGHEAMFYHLGRVREWMADWLEVHARPNPAPVPVSPPALPPS